MGNCIFVNKILIYRTNRGPAMTKPISSWDLDAEVPGSNAPSNDKRGTESEPLSVMETNARYTLASNASNVSEVGQGGLSKS